ncbi:MAG: hypothetical protein C4B58_16240 [Deltaproteobacteria bacterium]|nr:MAG: hypothetical protein C4B58_16240 [Deltaproteobacteria bacterium]
MTLSRLRSDCLLLFYNTPLWVNYFFLNPLLDSDVMETFPNDKAVNEALRLVIKLTKLTMSKKKSAPHKEAYSST